jgi:uncharacterized membrane protein YedE/YeeE
LKKNELKEWGWLKAGLIVSGLSIASYYLFESLKIRKYPFGITGGFASLAEKISRLFGTVSDQPYFQKIATKPDSVIELFLLIGLVIGGYLAARFSSSFSPESIPQTWIKFQGPSVLKRLIFVLGGGLMLGFGAALAAGCTTGNILQGWAHLSLGSLVAGICFFIGGMIAVRLLLRHKGV